MRKKLGERPRPEGDDAVSADVLSNPDPERHLRVLHERDRKAALEKPDKI
ncbi:hypothetical protein [Cupriavidus pampae]|jgi:hypothetical protein|nr:hypothetical protein [Cupriavidus pampae]